MTQLFPDELTITAVRSRFVIAADTMPPRDPEEDDEDEPEEEPEEEDDRVDGPPVVREPDEE